MVQALIRQLGDTGGADGQSVCSEPMLASDGGGLNSRQFGSIPVSTGCVTTDDLAQLNSRSLTPMAGGGGGMPQLRLETLTGALSLLLSPQLPLMPQPQPAPPQPALAYPITAASAAPAGSGNIQAQLISAAAPSGALQNGNALNLPPVPVPTEPFLIEAADTGATAGDWTEHVAARGALAPHVNANGASTPTGIERSATAGGAAGGGPVGLMARLASAIPMMSSSSARERDRERDRDRDRERDRDRDAAGSTASGSGPVPMAGSNYNIASTGANTPRSRLEALGLPALRTGSMDGGPNSTLDCRTSLAGATSMRLASNLGLGASGVGGSRSGVQLQLHSSKVIPLANSPAPLGAAGAGLVGSAHGMMPPPASLPPGPPPPVIEEVRRACCGPLTPTSIGMGMGMCTPVPLHVHLRCPCLCVAHISSSVVSLSGVGQVERLLGDADSWAFDTWRLAEATQGHALSALAFYLMYREGLIAKFKIKPAVLARLLRALEAGEAG